MPGVGQNPVELISEELPDDVASAGALLIGQDDLLARTAMGHALDHVSRLSPRGLPDCLCAWPVSGRPA